MRQVAGFLRDTKVTFRSPASGVSGHWSLKVIVCGFYYKKPSIGEYEITVDAMDLALHTNPNTMVIEAGVIKRRGYSFSVF